MFLRKYNTLTVTGTTAIRIPIIKRGVVDFAVGADWTPAAGDVKIAIDGAAAANVTNLPTAVAMGNGAYWEFILTAAELTCKSCVVTVADSATKAVEDQAFIVETFGHASAMYPVDLSASVLPVNVTHFGGTAGTFASGVPEVKVASIATDAVNAAALAANAVTEIQSGLATATNVSDAQTAIIAQVDANETKIDTVIAKTNNLPSDPADQSVIIAATDAILTAVGTRSSQTSVDTVDTVVDAIKVKSDQLTFTVANKVDSTAVLDSASRAAILTQELIESYAADGAAPTVAQALMMLLQHHQQKSVSGTTVTIKKLDKSTTAATYTLDSATDPTSITRAT